MARSGSSPVERYLLDNPEEWRAIAKSAPGDAADIIEEIDHQQVGLLLDQLEPSTISEVLEELNPQHAGDLLGSLAPDQLSSVLDQMGNAAAAEILDALAEDQVELLLDQLPTSVRKPITELLTYPPDSAGRLMSTELATITQGITAAEAIGLIRRLHEQIEDLSYVYVVDEQNRLSGVLSFRDLVFITPETEVDQAMVQHPVMVHPETDREEVAELAQRYHLLGVPVVEDGGRLLGTVTTESVLESVQQEASEDFAVAMGAEVDETFRSPVISSVRARLPWIVVDLIMSIGVVAAITRFTPILDSFVVLAALMPLVARIGGDAGAQSLAVVIRALATEGIPRRWFRKVLGREALIGAYNGLAIGFLSGMLGFLMAEWRGEYDPFLIGLAMFLASWANMIVAGLAGAGIPFLLLRLGQDPALGSNLILTAVTDLLGFSGFLAVATLLLS